MSAPPKRFFKAARVAETDGGATVALDGRSLRTPGKLAFIVPTRALAEACAAEWNAQGDAIIPHTMPLTRLANVAIERTPQTRDALVATIAKHGETDLLCHRADAPGTLVARQSAAWDPLVAWAGDTLSFRPRIVTGVAAAPNDIAPLSEAAAALDDFRLTALAHGVGLAGSAILGFALLRGRVDAAAAFDAAHLDDLFQIETWGEDDEARARLENIRTEINAVARFLTAFASP
ncbi:MAG: ATPase [Alphaproteobacteria bacterium]|nr:ATPase [Alphaproteobacteria bacterium]